MYPVRRDCPGSAAPLAASCQVATVNGAAPLDLARVGRAGGATLRNAIRAPGILFSGKNCGLNVARLLGCERRSRGATGPKGRGEGCETQERGREGGGAVVSQPERR